MERLIIAIPQEKTRDTVKGALESAGLAVRASVRTGAEVLRQINFMGGGLVVCACRLPDMTAAQLSDDLEGSALLLTLGTPEQLSLLDSKDLFTLPSPFSRGELITAVRLLHQMEEKQLMRTLPQKSAREKALLQHAKELLMASRGLSENEAHKTLQQMSMRRGVKTAVVAEELVKEYEAKKQ